MTSHPNFTKGSFPLLSITQNICIQIYRFILVHLLLLAHFLLSGQYFRTTRLICKMKDSRSGRRSKAYEGGTQRTELRHKAGPEVPKEQGLSTAHDMLLPDET